MGQAALPAAILARSPAWYGAMQETSGSVAIDSSGNNHNGTYLGGFALNQAGIIPGGKEVVFDGSTGYCSVPTITSSALTQCSIGAWIDRKSGQDSAVGWLLGDNGEDSTNRFGLEWYTNNTLYCVMDDGATPVFPNAVVAEGPTFVLMVYDGTQAEFNDRATLYINGEAVLLAAGNNPPASLPSPTGNFQIGFSGYDNEYSDSGFSNVFVVNGALSASDALSIYNAGISSGGLPPSLYDQQMSGGYSSGGFFE